MEKIFASSVAVLDSDVYKGGGTNVTKELQAVLDKAKNGGVHLIMDGAALISGLKVHSNTIIECQNSSCGFFLEDNTNRPLIVNADWSLGEIKNKDITLIGGTYNHNCTKQLHHVSGTEFPHPQYKQTVDPEENHCIYLMELYGVENLTLRDVTFRNQRTYAFLLGNFKNALIENTSIDMADHVHPSNQDGFHFFGPGQFLTMKNIRGCTGDDFINIGPDEMDGESSITDVLIDGVFFDNVCQGIRMLSRGSGVLDRVTVRNVTGTYRTFGFSIIPFYHGDTFGNIGDLYFENINLRQIQETYHYTPLTYFHAGGNIKSLTLKDIRFHAPVRNSLIFDIGRPFFYRPPELTMEERIKYHLEQTVGNYVIDWMPEIARPKIGTLTVDGLSIIADKCADNVNVMELRYNIDNVVVKNVQIFRSEDSSVGGNVIKLGQEANIKNFIVEDIFAEKAENIISTSEDNKIELLKADNITLKNGKDIFDINDGVVDVALTTNLNEI